MATFYTVGHSNMSIESFVSLLQAHEIQTLVDIRSFPGSRRCPWFNSENMYPYLMEHGIGYVHILKLGGRRNKQKEIDPRINDGWQNASFKNYADYTLTPEFEVGLSRLIDIADERRIAYCCSESVPWKCHRLIVSNTLVVRGHEVYHIMNETKLEKHKVGQWGAHTHCDHGVITYPSDTPVQTLLHL